MFSVTVLASSSGGNCSLLTVGHRKYLVDAGLSARQIAQRLDTLGVKLEDLAGVFITHEHIDHVCGLAVLLKKNPMPVYCNALTGETLRRGVLSNFRNWHFFQTGGEFSIGDLTVQTFHIPHDAVDPVGYSFHSGRDCISFLTDLGYATGLAIERVRDAHTLVLESNHDEKMLQDCPKRPWALKQRILSRHGHLSNAAAAEVITNLLDRNLRQLVLGHLSRDCNTPDIALLTMRNKLTALGVDNVTVHCASPVEISPSFVVTQRQEEIQIGPIGYEQKEGTTSDYVAELFREFAEADAT